MDFTLDQVTSPFFPFSFTLDGKVWTSVAQFAYVNSLPCPDRQKDMYSMFERNNDSPRPWNTLDLHHNYLQLMHACFKDWFLAELDVYWTTLFNENAAARQRLIDTGTALLCVPELEGAADILMLHRQHLSTPIERCEEKAKVLHLLEQEFQPH